MKVLSMPPNRSHSQAVLRSLAQTLGEEKSDSFEVLFEVFGFDKTNFGGEVIYSHALDTQVIWETRLINQ